jgi:hypothetical protein
MDKVKISLFTGSRRIIFLVSALVIVLGLAIVQFNTTRAATGLSVEIIAGYNLVVDSNVKSPSTYGPSVATVIGKFCNINPSGTLTNIVGYIGDFTNGTPGIYPVRTSEVGNFDTEHPHLAGSGSYSFTHLGGAVDAVRYIGDIPAGECRVQYWSFEYPRCEGGETPPCTDDPVWGLPTVPGDDLYLTFDVWGKGDSGAADNATWKMTMRNEISAMANKIEPNPDGYWETRSPVVHAGDVITSTGYLYTFGNVNKGFDNDDDLLYDYNAWMQPFGDPSYDPSCFRLIRTTGVLTVTRGGAPPMYINISDQLYFTNLPSNNTNVTGIVYYTFLALGGVCTTHMTPYQEAASGADNEKFNADFGTGVPPLVSYAPSISFSKGGC